MNDLIEHAAGGAGDGCFVDGAILEGVGHVLWIELHAEISHALTRRSRLFGIWPPNMASFISAAVWGPCAAEAVAAASQRMRDEGAHGTGLATRHLHVEAGVDEVDRMGRAPVRRDEPFESDLVAKDARQRGLIAASKGAIEAVIGAHD